ncbi:homeobox protein CDX-2 isoform X2 [Equus asinus]|uniref:homeobox protein CDX-2 isoform X2 n=1 Tax=Equus asinus TaxID=9793 RepID=UPI0038F71D32
MQVMTTLQRFIANYSRINQEQPLGAVSGHRVCASLGTCQGSSGWEMRPPGEKATGPASEPRLGRFPKRRRPRLIRPPSWFPGGAGRLRDPWSVGCSARMGPGHCVSRRIQDTGQHPRNICSLAPQVKTRTKDKYRVVYTDHQRLELEKEFHYSRYITIRRKAELAATLGLSERQVKIWFQNRRAKERKINKKKLQQQQQQQQQPQQPQQPPPAPQPAQPQPGPLRSVPEPLSPVSSLQGSVPGSVPGVLGPTGGVLNPTVTQ